MEKLESDYPWIDLMEDCFSQNHEEIDLEDLAALWDRMHSLMKTEVIH